MPQTCLLLKIITVAPGLHTLPCLQLGSTHFHTDGTGVRMQATIAVTPLTGTDKPTTVLCVLEDLLLP
jgi:hypothetical protein